MTEKVQKIRKEVERLKSNLIYGACASQVVMETYCKEEAYNEVLAILDTMQEEPVSEDWLDMSKIDCKIQYANIESGIHAHAEDYSFNIESQLFNQLTKEQQELWRKEIEQAVISGGHCGVELARDKRYKENQEPVSEDLDSFAIKYAQDKPYPVAVCQAVKAGAKWQAEQFEKNRLKHCNGITNEQAELEQGFIDQHLDKHQRMPTFLDAIEYGINWQKKQMMKDAIERVVKLDAGGYPYIDGTIELYDYSEDKPLAKAGDKAMIIIVKEDWLWKQKN